MILGIGLQAPSEGGRPPAYQSVLLVTGLLVLYVFLLRLADALGADFGGGGDTLVWANLPPGAMVWTSLVLAGAAGWAALSRRSAVCLLIAALATGLALLAALAWIFGSDSQGPYRFLLLVLAIALVLGSLVLRGSEPRHAEQLINAAGVAILVIPLVALGAGALQLLSLFGGAPDHLLPDFWELVVLAAGCGLVAFGAVDRAPGAAYLGFANLLAFIVVVAISPDETLLWWPLLLILLGARRDARRAAPAQPAAARARPLPRRRAAARRPRGRGDHAPRPRRLPAGLSASRSTRGLALRRPQQRLRAALAQDAEQDVLRGRSRARRPRSPRAATARAPSWRSAVNGT